MIAEESAAAAAAERLARAKRQRVAELAAKLDELESRICPEQV